MFCFVVNWLCICYLEMSCDRNSNGVMTRSKTKDLEAQVEVRPEDSVSNVGSRASFMSGLSVAQIEYEEQLKPTALCSTRN